MHGSNTPAACHTFSRHPSNTERCLLPSSYEEHHSSTPRIGWLLDFHMVRDSYQNVFAELLFVANTGLDFKIRIQHYPTLFLVPDPIPFSGTEDLLLAAEDALQAKYGSSIVFLRAVLRSCVDYKGQFGSSGSTQHLPRKVLEVRVRNASAFRRIVRDLSRGPSPASAGETQSSSKPLSLDHTPSAILDCFIVCGNEIPYELSFASQNSTRIGYWYSVAYDGAQYSLSPALDLCLVKPPLRLLAFNMVYDDERSSASERCTLSLASAADVPHLHPASQLRNKIHMISLVAGPIGALHGGEGRGVLLVNTSISGGSSSLESFTTPADNNDGNNNRSASLSFLDFQHRESGVRCAFSIEGAGDEESLIRRFLEIVSEWKPHVVTAFNDSLGGFSALAERAALYKLSLFDKSEKSYSFSYCDELDEPEDDACDEDRTYNSGYSTTTSYKNVKRTNTRRTDYTAPGKTPFVYLDLHSLAGHDSALLPFLSAGSVSLGSISRGLLGFSSAPLPGALKGARQERIIAASAISDAVSIAALYDLFFHDYAFSLFSSLLHLPVSYAACMRSKSSSLFKTLVTTEGLEQGVIFLEHSRKRPSPSSEKYRDSETASKVKRSIIAKEPTEQYEIRRPGIYRQSDELDLDYVSAREVMEDVIRNFDEIFCAGSGCRSKLDSSSGAASGTAEDENECVWQQLKRVLSSAILDKDRSHGRIYRIDVRAILQEVMVRCLVDFVEGECKDRTGATSEQTHGAVSGCSSTDSLSADEYSCRLATYNEEETRENDYKEKRLKISSEAESKLGRRYKLCCHSLSDSPEYEGESLGQRMETTNDRMRYQPNLHLSAVKKLLRMIDGIQGMRKEQKKDAVEIQSSAALEAENSKVGDKRETIHWHHNDTQDDDKRAKKFLDDWYVPDGGAFKDSSIGRLAAYEAIVGIFYQSIVLKKSSSDWILLPKEATDAAAMACLDTFKRICSFVSKIGLVIQGNLEEIWCMLPEEFPVIADTERRRIPVLSLLIRYFAARKDPCGAVRRVVERSVAHNDILRGSLGNTVCEGEKSGLSEKEENRSMLRRAVIRHGAFDVDGPYQLMVVPVSESTTISECHHYVLDSNHRLVRGYSRSSFCKNKPLLLMQLEEDILSEASKAADLKDCYSTIYSVCRYWLSLVDSHCQSLSEAALLELLSERCCSPSYTLSELSSSARRLATRCMKRRIVDIITKCAQESSSPRSVSDNQDGWSCSVQSFSDQNKSPFSTLLSSVPRGANFRGRLNHPGHCCEFVVSCLPSEESLGNRLLPAVFFSDSHRLYAENEHGVPCYTAAAADGGGVRHVFLEHWLGSEKSSGTTRLHDLIDWSHYRRQLEGVIHRMVVHTARAQNITDGIFVSSLLQTDIDNSRATPGSIPRCSRGKHANQAEKTSLHSVSSCKGESVGEADGDSTRIFQGSKKQLNLSCFVARETTMTTEGSGAVREASSDTEGTWKGSLEGMREVIQGECMSAKTDSVAATLQFGSPSQQSEKIAENLTEVSTAEMTGDREKDTSSSNIYKSVVDTNPQSLSVPNSGCRSTARSLGDQKNKIFFSDGNEIERKRGGVLSEISHNDSEITRRYADNHTERSPADKTLFVSFADSESASRAFSDFSSIVAATFDSENPVVLHKITVPSSGSISLLHKRLDEYFAIRRVYSFPDLLFELLVSNKETCSLTGRWRHLSVLQGNGEDSFATRDNLKTRKDKSCNTERSLAAADSHSKLRLSTVPQDVLSSTKAPYCHSSSLVSQSEFSCSTPCCLACISSFSATTKTAYLITFFCSRNRDSVSHSSSSDMGPCVHAGHPGILLADGPWLEKALGGSSSVAVGTKRLSVCVARSLESFWRREVIHGSSAVQVKNDRDRKKKNRTALFDSLTAAIVAASVSESSYAALRELCQFPLLRISESLPEALGSVNTQISRHLTWHAHTLRHRLVSVLDTCARFTTLPASNVAALSAAQLLSVLYGAECLRSLSSSSPSHAKLLPATSGCDFSLYHHCYQSHHDDLLSECPSGTATDERHAPGTDGASGLAGSVISARSGIYTTYCVAIEVRGTLVLSLADNCSTTTSPFSPKGSQWNVNGMQPVVRLVKRLLAEAADGSVAARALLKAFDSWMADSERQLATASGSLSTANGKTGGISNFSVIPPAVIASCRSIQRSFTAKLRSVLAAELGEKTIVYSASDSLFVINTLKESYGEALGCIREATERLKKEVGNGLLRVRIAWSCARMVVVDEENFVCLREIPQEVMNSSDRRQREYSPRASVREEPRVEAMNLVEDTGLLQEQIKKTGDRDVSSRNHERLSAEIYTDGNGGAAPVGRSRIAAVRGVSEAKYQIMSCCSEKHVLPLELMKNVLFVERKVDSESVLSILSKLPRQSALLVLRMLAFRHDASDITKSCARALKLENAVFFGESGAEGVIRRRARASLAHIRCEACSFMTGLVKRCPACLRKIPDGLLESAARIAILRLWRTLRTRSRVCERCGAPEVRRLKDFCECGGILGRTGSCRDMIAEIVEYVRSKALAEMVEELEMYYGFRS